MCGWILGILAGLAIGGMIQRRRAWRHRRGPWGLLRALELDGGQRDELKELFFGLKRSARGMRQQDDWRRVLEVLAAPSFDRGKVEAASAEKAAAFERLRSELVSALEKAHAVLRPEQRARLADWFQVGFAPSGGPYR
jgi:Spy/CpxP family protein refolding chaperone